MKKNVTSLGLMLATVLTLTVNCAKQEVAAPECEQPVEQENVTSAVDPVPFQLLAGSGLDTKTSTTDGATINWVVGDRINVFHTVAGGDTYGSNDEFTIDAENPASNKFSGALSAGPLDPSKSYDWYALYPYDSHITTPANTASGYLSIGSKSKSTAQVQAGNNSKAHLAGQYFPLYGKAEGVAAATSPSISLYQALSVIRVHVTNANETSLTVSSISFTANEPIVGSYYINFAGTSPSFIESGENYVSNTANLTVTSGAALAQNATADFYIAVKPFTAAAASTLTVSVNGYEKQITIGGSDVEFKPGKIKTVNFSYDYVNNLSEPTAKTGWYRVEDASWLAAGDRVVIANNDGTKAMSKTFKSSNRDGVDVTTAEDGDYKVLTLNDNIQLFILETGSASGSFAYWSDNGGDPNKYMCAASSSSNNLKFKNEIDGESSFIANLTDGLGNLTAQGEYTRKVVQWNNLFNCYSAASYNAISIYKYYGVYNGPTVCATPTIEQDGASVSITTTTIGATIYYTIDGSEPTSTSTKYTAPFSLAASTTVKAIAIRSHYTNSGVASLSCSAKVATPEISSSANSFAITCATPGATIYYEISTVDLASVATPTTSSTTYSSSVPYAATTYVKAYAVKDGYLNSEVATATCTYSADLQVTLQYTTNTTTNMTGNNDAATLGLNAEKWSVVAAKGSNSNYPGLNKAKDIRLYWAEGGSNSITVSALESGVTITSITITYTANAYSNGVVLVGGNPVEISDGAYPINSTSFVVTNGNTSNTQVRISKIVISYTTSD